MRLLIATTLVVILTIGVSATAVAQQVGRYQVIAAPAGGSEASPTLVLLDTETGQTWFLIRVPYIQWVNLRYWVGEKKTGALLPPPATFGAPN